ncbi:helix-turn-helix domain-containing protein [Actinomadura sp. ATCC 31491]|uniref:Helix-turn-helix domain-containing protein n=1 Tax=Actinomadura luzonensis TaxID=2805427 RepID=A0ABT0FV58_9ACTN|nr:helix-turn-helix domain-containing protein [Actinomadura luzonensis]MCK2216149.1 helix-turn-helix domain-containing protein [Actinomadura luzonensis]
MEQYTVEQAAGVLGLHVKTVRNYVRDGRLPAVRVGKRYRIAKDDLAAFAGLPAPAASAPRRAEVSAIVQLDGIGRAEMDRVTTMVTGSLSGRPNGVRVQFAYEEERAALKVIVLGELEPAAQVLRIIDALTRQ